MNNCILKCKLLKQPSFALHRQKHLCCSNNNSKYDLVKLISKLDSQNKLVQIEKKDIEMYTSAGSTKGGQKANRSKSLVTLHHKPTNVIVKAFDSRNLIDNQRIAMARLRKAVDLHLRGNESIFRTMEEENRLKNLEIKAEKLRIAEEKKAQKDKLKKLLSEEDTLIY